MRKRIYLAGPISKGDVAANVKAATKVAAELIAKGFAPLCPQLSCFMGYHTEDYLFDRPQAEAAGIKHAEWLESDLPWVAVSDAVLRLPGESAGADEEVAMAEQLGIPVFNSADTIQFPERPCERFTSGSTRDSREGKGRFDLLPPRALRRLAQHFERGAVKYGDRNWEKGQPLQRYLDSALRHVFNHQEGKRDEDHLISAAWNLLAYVETEARIKDGHLPASLDDFPWATEADEE